MTLDARALREAVEEARSQATIIQVLGFLAIVELGVYGILLRDEPYGLVLLLVVLVVQVWLLGLWLPRRMRRRAQSWHDLPSGPDAPVFSIGPTGLSGLVAPPMSGGSSQAQIAGVTGTTGSPHTLHTWDAVKVRHRKGMKPPQLVVTVDGKRHVYPADALRGVTPKELVEAAR